MSQLWYCYFFIRQVSARITEAKIKLLYIQTYRTLFLSVTSQDKSVITEKLCNLVSNVCKPKNTLFVKIQSNDIDFLTRSLLQDFMWKISAKSMQMIF